MTTRRHAARSSNVNGTPSINGSVDDDYSQRGSFDDGRPTTSQSQGSQHSLKGRRISDASYNGGASEVNASFDAMSSTERPSDRGKSKQFSPVAQPQSPTRKRKRSSQTPPDTPNGIAVILASPGDEGTQSFDRDAVYVEMAVDEQGSDRESNASEDSAGAFGPYLLSVKPSAELTPADSGAVSPVSENSNMELLTPRKQSEMLATVKQAIAADEVDDLDDGADADDVDDGDDIDDADDQAKGDGDGRARRRIYGRRRADHHVPDVEAAMRRQLQLKSAFRAITRALKPVLAEIALKTVEQIEGNPSIVENVVEYTGTEEEPGIKKRLDGVFERRKAQLDAQLKWNRIQLEQTMIAEKAARMSRFATQIDQDRERELDELEHQWLLLARKLQLKSHQESLDTDDEDDDVLARIKGMNYRYERTTTLDPKYDSRSRVGLELRHAIEDMQARFAMYEMLKDVKLEDEPEKMGTFTVMDNERRRAAIARREAAVNVQTLLAALEETERRSKIPIIPNEQAIGLQLLGDLAHRPSVQMQPKPAYPPFFEHLGAEYMPPPLRPPISMNGPDYDMSPRSQGFHDRFPRMSTHPPRSRHQSFSDNSRRDIHLMSPATITSRPNPFVPLAMKSVEGDQMSQRGSVPPPHHRLSDVFDPARERPPSSHMSPRGRDEPPLDYYHRQSFTIDPHLRSLPPPDRSVHEFSRGGPLLIERIEPHDAPRPLNEHRPDRVEDDGAQGRAFPPPLPRWDAPQTPEGHEVRARDKVSPVAKQEPTTREAPDFPKIPPSRAASLNLSAADFNGTKVRAPRQPRHKGVKMKFDTKPTKPERNGSSKRVFKPQRPDEKRPGNTSPTRDAGPSIHRFRLNTDQRPQTPQQPQPWQGSPPTRESAPTSVGEYAYPAQYGPPPPLPPPPAPPSSYGYGSYPYERGQSYTPSYQRHNSGPSAAAPTGPPGSLPPPTSRGWPPHPPSPLYAVPQPTPPADQWSSQQQSPFGPPHPPRDNGPLTLPPPPQSSMSHPPLAPGPAPSPYAHLSGPTLAPATPDHRNWLGTSSRLPVFAQQQRQQESAGSGAGASGGGPTSGGNGSGHQRRRTNSDVPRDSQFQHWNPRR